LFLVEKVQKEGNRSEPYDEDCPREQGRARALEGIPAAMQLDVDVRKKISEALESGNDVQEGN
jgi:hypothetical protein